MSQEVIQYLNDLINHAEDMEQRANTLLMDLVTYCETTLKHVETATKYLVEEELHVWREKQRWNHNGPQEKQSELLPELDTLDFLLRSLYVCIFGLTKYKIIIIYCFEKYGVQIQIFRSSVEKLNLELQAVRNQAAESSLKSIENCKKMLEMLVFNFIVNLLGGAALGGRASTASSVSVSLVYESEVRKFYAEKRSASNNPDEAGELSSRIAYFGTYPARGNDPERYFAAFQRPLSLTKIAKPRPQDKEVPKQRYFFLFKISTMAINANNTLIGWKISLPFAVLVHPNQIPAAEANITWSLMAKHVDQQVYDDYLNISIPWDTAVEGLNLKFMQLIEPINGCSEQHRPIQGLSNENKNHLANKLGKHGALSWQQFFEVASVKRDKDAHAYTKGSLVSFWMWFYCAAKIIREHMFLEWNKNLILGFMDKSETEKMLRNSDKPVISIKFSDNMMGCLLFCYYKPGFTPDLEWLCLYESHWNKIDRPLIGIINDLPELQGIEWIYPDRKKSELKVERKGKTAAAKNPTTDLWYARRIIPGFATNRDVDFTWECPTPSRELDMLLAELWEGESESECSITPSHAENNEDTETMAWEETQTRL